MRDRLGISNVRWVRNGCVVLLVALLWLLPWANPAFAAGGDKDKKLWSIGLTMGSYAPALNQLNHVLATRGEVILQDPNFLIPQNQDLPIEVRDVATPKLTAEVSYGLEAQYMWKPRIAFVIMAMNWQGRSTISDTITMSLRSNLPAVQAPRTARYNLNVNQLWLGWRYYLFDHPGGGRMFVNMGVAGVSFADFTIDSLIKVQLPDEPLIPSFASISSTEFHGTAFSSRFGLGGEVFVTRHVSFGFHVNFIVGELKKLTVSRFFPAGFSTLPPTPPQTTDSLPQNVLPTNFRLPEVGEQLASAPVTISRNDTELVGNQTDILIDLDGWEAALTLRVHY